MTENTQDADVVEDLLSTSAEQIRKKALQRIIDFDVEDDNARFSVDDQAPSRCR